MTAAQLISFARGAPSLDIVDVAGLKAAAARAFDVDPVAVTGYGPATGYPALREWIAARHGVTAEQVLVTTANAAPLLLVSVTTGLVPSGTLTKLDAMPATAFETVAVVSGAAVGVT